MNLNGIQVKREGVWWCWEGSEYGYSSREMAEAELSKWKEGEWDKVYFEHAERTLTDQWSVRPSCETGRWHVARKVGNMYEYLCRGLQVSCFPDFYTSYEEAAAEIQTYQEQEHPTKLPPVQWGEWGVVVSCDSSQYFIARCGYCEFLNQQGNVVDYLRTPSTYWTDYKEACQALQTFLAKPKQPELRSGNLYQVCGSGPYRCVMPYSPDRWGIWVFEDSTPAYITGTKQVVEAYVHDHQFEYAGNIIDRVNGTE